MSDGAGNAQSEWVITVREADPSVLSGTFGATWHGRLPGTIRHLEGAEIFGTTPWEAVSELIRILRMAAEQSVAAVWADAIRDPGEPKPPSGETVSVSEEIGLSTMVHTMTREMFEQFMEAAHEKGWLE